MFAHTIAIGVRGTLCGSREERGRMSDLINRQDAINAINALNNGLLYTHMDYVDAVRSVPSADASLMQDRCKMDASSDLISRQDVINEIEERQYANRTNVALMSEFNRLEGYILRLPSAEPELLTDKEQRIFLAAMGREEEICKQVDEECRDCREPYEDSLVRTCHEIIRKVKSTLWTQ